MIKNPERVGAMSPLEGGQITVGRYNLHRFTK